MINIKTLTGSTLLALSLTLSGCGGGGGGNSNSLSAGAQFSGNDDPAEVTGDNVEDIGRAAGEAVIQAYNSGEAPLPGGVAIETKPFDAVRFAQELLTTDIPPALPSAATINLSSEQCSSGTWVVTYPDNQTGNGNWTFRFNNCHLINTNITYDGNIYMYFEDMNDEDSDFSIRYEDFTYTSPEYSINNLNYTIECINGECTELSDFESEDGYTHRISNFDISGDEDTGINGTATFYHEVHGVVYITIEDLTFGGECSPYPESGTISFESENGSSGYITFNDTPCSVTSDWDSGDN